ncbi:MAG: hypothetical protein ACLVFS_05070 [Butyricicoccus sp.]
MQSSRWSAPLSGMARRQPKRQQRVSRQLQQLALPDAIPETEDGMIGFHKGR